MKERTVLTMVVLFVAALIAVTAIFAFGTNRASVTGNVVSNGASGSISAELFGKASSVSIACYDVEQDTTTQVSTTVYYWVTPATEYGNPIKYGPTIYGGTAACSNSARVAVTTPVIADKFNAIAFDSTYDYGVEKEILVSSAAPLLNLDVSKGSASQTITIYDENGDAVADPSGTGVTVGSTNYIIDKIRVTNTDDKSLWNTKYVGFDYAENTNITEIKVSGASLFSGAIQKTGAKSAEEWYTFEHKLNDDNTRADTGSVTVVPNGNDINAETVTIYVMDEAPFITKANTLSYGFENDANAPVDVGVADKTQALLLA